jgi:hypothetical protein
VVVLDLLDQPQLRTARPSARGQPALGDRDGADAPLLALRLRPDDLDGVDDRVLGPGERGWVSSSSSKVNTGRSLKCRRCRVPWPS